MLAIQVCLRQEARLIDVDLVTYFNRGCVFLPKYFTHDNAGHFPGQCGRAGPDRNKIVFESVLSVGGWRLPG